MGDLAKVLKPADIVVADASYASIWIANYLPSLAPGMRFLTPRGMAGLGWGLPMALGAKLARFRGLDVVNLAVAANARGGPGIVLASVAYEAGIISSAFYTTLVLVAIVTSQAAGAWLEFVLRKGWALLSGDEATATAATEKGPEQIAA